MSIDLQFLLCWAENMSLSQWYVSSLLEPGVGVTKAVFVNFSIISILDLAEVPIGLIELHSYMTGVTTVEQQW